MKMINAQNAPKAVGPYSHATVMGGVLYVSGQLPIDPETSKFPSDDIVEQTEQSLKNVLAIVEAAGSSLEDIARVGIFLADMNDFALVNEVYAKYFSLHKPARACVEVAALPLGARVEIECIAKAHE